jgi:hypothetical protein
MDEFLCRLFNKGGRGTIWMAEFSAVEWYAFAREAGSNCGTCGRCYPD